jgi:O-antigen/teichoic acid export membrane protein
MIAISPILTRLYTPEEFGIFALYSSILYISASLSTGKYELAILLPSGSRDSLAVVLSSLIILSIIVLFSILIVLIFNDELASLLPNENIIYWLYFLPLAILLSGVYRNLNYLSIREENYPQIARSKVEQSLGTSSVSLFFGYFNSGVFGLVFGSIFGLFLANYSLYKKVIRLRLKEFKCVTKKEILQTIKEYINFPKHEMPASFINAVSRHMIPFLFVAYFTPILAGYYYLTQRVIGLPANIIASAISDVFRQEATKDFKKFNNSKDIYISTFKKLFLIGLFPSIFLFFFSKDLFILFFGPDWAVAGDYAQILTPMLFIRFISTPLSFMFVICGKQLYNLIGQTVLSIGILCSFIIGTYFDSSMLTVLFISFFSSLFYFLYIFMSYRMALGKS